MDGCQQPEEARIESNYLLNREFLLDDGNVLELDRCMCLHNIVSALNATELYTLQWLILCVI